MARWQIDRLGSLVAGRGTQAVSDLFLDRVAGGSLVHADRTND